MNLLSLQVRTPDFIWLTTADQGAQDLSGVTDLEPQAAPSADELPNLVPDDFDEDTYLRAFPDVAQAVADGIYSSPFQHYMERGRQENRISHHSHLLPLQGRQIEGHIDFYGHHSLAGGWMFCGWSTERWDETETARVVARFRNGDIAGESIAAFYRRDGLRGRGTGLLLFVQAMNEPLVDLASIDIRVGGEFLTIAVEARAQAMSDQDVASSVRPIMLVEQDSANCRELLLLFSTSGYGRLRQPLNTLDGFVDLCGYHGASGGWFFCGWVTRSWDSKVGPDKFIVHFADGNLVSDETTIGFYSRDDMEDRGVGFVLFVRGSGRPLGSLASIEVQVGGRASFIRAGSTSQRLREADLAGRLRPIVSQIGEPDTTVALLSLLSRHPYVGTDTLSALSDPVFLEFDEVIACPPDGVVVMGWVLAKPGIVRAMRLRSSAMNEPFDFDNCIKVQRPDVIAGVGAEHGFDDPRCGFIAYVPCAPLSNTEMYMEVETAQRAVGYRKLPAPKLDGVVAIKRILNSFDVRYNEVSRGFDRTIGPAVGLINRNRMAIRPRADMVEFGQVNTSPEFTIIIPLYGRLDFIEYQLAFLSSHKPAYGYEIIYILDDPPKQREAERLFHSAYARFQIPFRALMMDQNAGFAPANNVGLRAARGRYICFMNSDVFPAGTPDWLERLAQQLETHPDLGTIGPTLIYGDGSVQHDGMIFKNLPEFGNWSFGDHPGKGMRRAPSPGLIRHISITGACMLMRRTVALELGGFDESYVIGDFEDSDLCLRLHAMGLGSAVDRAIQLYHLERKSQASSAQAWRMNLTLYNAWVHERRWADTIAMHPLRNGPNVYGPSDLSPS
jgi:GT2 family glycosyltransferase